jgi:antitoxin component of RelBE/YafQ-DinJ toxin-antitoxin module
MRNVQLNTLVSVPSSPNAISVQIVADTAADALDMLDTILAHTGDVPVKATISTAEQKAELVEKLEEAAKPAKAKEKAEAVDPAKQGKKDKDAALALVTNHYTNKDLRPKFKELLASFDVERFSAIPDEKGSDFLSAVKGIVG